MKDVAAEALLVDFDGLVRRARGATDEAALALSL
jgi:hypothetical protein